MYTKYLVDLLKDDVRRFIQDIFSHFLIAGSSAKDFCNPGRIVLWVTPISFGKKKACNELLQAFIKSNLLIDGKGCSNQIHTSGFICTEKFSAIFIQYISCVQKYIKPLDWHVIQFHI